MGTYTLDMDFSALNGPKANEWLANFREIARDAFADKDSRCRLLGNLLVLERYIHTLEQGLRQTGKPLSKGTRSAVDQLWAYLEGHTVPADFADFANNLYACLLFYDVGESLSDEQAAFDKAYFGDVDYLRAGEDTAAGWAFGVLLQLVAIEGGRLDYSEFTRCTQVDFAGIQEMLELLDDACIELTGTPCPSNEAGNYLNALKEVHLTPLFRQIVSHIQHDLQTARTALPEQYGALREAYREKTILPEEYAGAFLAC
ncbi:MAG: hypothetical protein HFF86_01500 [Oscillibacter sp.]|nr:hypothetical protein [Oscillibacter sp.]